MSNTPFLWFIYISSLCVFFKENQSKDLIIFASMCLDTMDFSSMTLTQIKRQEMDAQVRTQLVHNQFYLHYLSVSIQPNLEIVPSQVSNSAHLCVCLRCWSWSWRRVCRRSGSVSASWGRSITSWRGWQRAGARKSVSVFNSERNRRNKIIQKWQDLRCVFQAVFESTQCPASLAPVCLD